MQNIERQYKQCIFIQSSYISAFAQVRKPRAIKFHAIKNVFEE